jgi:isoleucyl-tRNA synthetase
LYREFSKTQNKFESCVYALQDLSVSFAHTDELSLDLKISEFTQELSMMLEDSKLRDVVRAMRSFLYDWLSREYINECKDKGRKPDSSALSLIENVLGTVYKR